MRAAKDKEAVSAEEGVENLYLIFSMIRVLFLVDTKSEEA